MSWSKQLESQEWWILCSDSIIFLIRWLLYFIMFIPQRASLILFPTQGPWFVFPTQGPWLLFSSTVDYLETMIFVPYQYVYRDDLDFCSLSLQQIDFVTLWTFFTKKIPSTVHNKKLQKRKFQSWRISHHQHLLQSFSCWWEKCDLRYEIYRDVRKYVPYVTKRWSNNLCVFTLSTWWHKRTYPKSEVNDWHDRRNNKT